MPVVFRQNGYHFFFYSNEGDPLEPVHIHIYKDGADAKFWVQPEVNLAYNAGFSAHAGDAERHRRRAARRDRKGMA